MFSLQATLIPGIGIEVFAGVRIGALLYGELEIIAEVFNTKFPITAEIWFSKFPMDIA